MEKVRVTSGKYRGTVLATPGGGTHPMGARERLALFNMIAGYLPGATVLDAYAGSGALGIEAASREATEVIFIEENRRAAGVIRQNLDKLALEAEVITADANDFTTEMRFGVIMVDPPYDRFERGAVEHLGKFLAEGGVFVLSHPGEAPDLAGLKLEKSRKYARASISIYR